MRRARLAAAAALAWTAAAAACTYDFHAFDQAHGAADAELGGDAATGGDAPSSGDDAGVDSTVPPFDAASIDATGCPGEPTCLTQAISCASACTQAEQTCEGKVGCSLSTTCIQQCKSTETACKQTCIDSCASCTTDAGCADPLSCRSASQ